MKPHLAAFALCAALLLSGCDLFTPPDSPPPALDGLMAFGRLHQPLGAAALAIDNGALVVSGLDAGGLSGLRVRTEGLRRFGFEVTMDLAERGRFQFAAQRLGALTVTTLAGPPTDGNTIKAEADTPPLICCTTWEFTPDFYPLGVRSYTVKVYIDGRLDQVRTNLKGVSTYHHSLPMKLVSLEADADSGESINCCALTMVLAPNLAGFHNQVETIVVIPEGVGAAAGIGDEVTLRAALFAASSFQVHAETGM